MVTKTAFLFPGQGAQTVGMGRDLCEAYPTAAALFDRAEAASALPLKQLCFEGPEDQLGRTDVCQPAIFTVSVVALEVMREVLGADAIVPTYAAGLSLGEYTALYAAGAMDFETGVRLVTRRGAAMQAAASAVESGMVSVLGLDEDKVAELCRAAAEGDVLTCANYNSPGQVVVSGAAAACERVGEMAADFGAKAAMPLKVAGAFHSELMRPAANELAEALEQVNFAPLKTTVIANVDASAYDGPGQIKDNLLSQLTGAVRWRQSMEALLADGVARWFEIGPGRVLTGLMRRIHRRADVTTVGTCEEIENLAASLQGKESEKTDG